MVDTPDTPSPTPEEMKRAFLGKRYTAPQAAAMKPAAKPAPKVAPRVARPVDPPKPVEQPKPVEPLSTADSPFVTPVPKPEEESRNMGAAPESRGYRTRGIRKDDEDEKK